MSYTPLADQRIVAVLGDVKHTHITAVRALVEESTAPLLARIAELYREITETYDENTQLERENERLRAALAEASKDAERLDWLRKEHQRHDPVCHLTWKKNNDRNGHEWVNTADFDAAIDAMKGTP